MTEMNGQIKNALPKGWQWVKVNGIAESIQYGYTESSSKEFVGPKFLRITDIQNNKVQWDNVPYCTIEENSKGKYLLKDGDLLFARTGATVGKSFLIKGHIPESVFASYLIRVRFKETILDKYVYNYFQSLHYWKQITEGQVGIGQPNVNGTKLGQLVVPIAPLDEQQQIVSKIEEFFSELDKSIEQLKIAQQQLKVYRQTALKWAFEGKLSESFRTKNNIDFHATIDKIFKTRIENFNAKISDAKKVKASKPRTPKNLDKKNKLNEDQLDFVGMIPKEWKVVHLAAISNDAPDSVVDGPFGSSINVNEDYINVGVPVIRINNILPLRFEKDKLKFIRREKFEKLRRHNILPGDILFGKVGTIGNSCIYPKSEPEGMLSTTGSCRIRVDEKVVLNTYVCYYLNYQKNNFNKIASAAVQAFLNMETINNFPIPLCSIEEQQQIIQEIESRLSVADKLEETITNSLQQAEALKQSILKKAFEGGFSL